MVLPRAEVSLPSLLTKGAISAMSSLPASTRHDDRTLRVTVIANMIDPNRLPVFERVAARDDCELAVLYESALEHNRDYGDGPRPRFRHTVLQSHTIDLQRLGTDAYLHIPRRPLKALRGFRPDVVIAAGGGVWSSPTNLASLAARRRGDWAFVPWWGSFSRVRPTWARRILGPWVRRFVAAGDAWIAYGSRAARELVQLGADPEGVVIVPNVARSATTHPNRDHDRPYGVRFLFVGQLIERKGLRELLDAFVDLGSGELWIAGDGPLREEASRVATLTDRIRLLGHLSWEELQAAYAAVDALVLPSRYEVWGLVVNEALERGLPVIVSDQVGAADDLVRHGLNGFVVQAGFTAGLVHALRTISAWSPDQWEVARTTSSATMDGWSRYRAAEALVEAARLGVERRSAARERAGAGATRTR
jgi:glycosyltransferase involved in cell wall biosynthesis